MKILLLFCFICFYAMSLSHGVKRQLVLNSSSIKSIDNNKNFSLVKVPNRHALVIKKIKKRIKTVSDLKKVATSTTKQERLLCVSTSTVQPEKYERPRGNIRSNTLFSSNNWGNMK